MQKLITVLRTDPDFLPYIRGTFSKKHRALPVQNYSISSDRERVTFSIQEISALTRPSRLFVFLTSIRPLYLSLGLGPLLSVIFLLLHQGHSISLQFVVYTSLSLLCLHSSVFLLNDYFDFTSGVDRQNPHKGSRVLTQGWLAAYQVRNLGYIFLMLGTFLALPVIESHFVSLFWLVVLAAVSVGSHSFMSVRTSLPWLSDGLKFLSLGPLLTFGFSVAISGSAQWETLLLGAVFGLLSLIIFQLKSLQHLFSERGGARRDVVGHMGFDRSRKLLVVELGGLFLLILTLFDFGTFQSLWFALPLAAVCLQLFKLMLRLLKSNSPIASSLQGSWKLAALAHFFFSIALISGLAGPWLIRIYSF